MYWDIQYQLGNLLIGLLGSAVTVVTVALVVLWIFWFGCYIVPLQTVANPKKWLRKRKGAIAFRILVGIFLIMAFASVQANAPKITLGVPQMTTENPYEEGEWKNTAPVTMTDEERMTKQRALDAETKSRVNLND